MHAPALPPVHPSTSMKLQWNPFSSSNLFYFSMKCVLVKTFGWTRHEEIPSLMFYFNWQRWYCGYFSDKYPCFDMVPSTIVDRKGEENLTRLWGMVRYLFVNSSIHQGRNKCIPYSCWTASFASLSGEWTVIPHVMEDDSEWRVSDAREICF